MCSKRSLTTGEFKNEKGTWSAVTSAISGLPLQCLGILLSRNLSLGRTNTDQPPRCSSEGCYDATQLALLGCPLGTPLPSCRLSFYLLCVPSSFLLPSLGSFIYNNEKKQNWKQPRCSSHRERTDCGTSIRWNPCSAIQRIALLLHAATWL